MLFASLAVAAVAFAFTLKDENEYFYKVNRGLEVFGQVYREVSQNYVDTVDPDAFISAGIDAMLKTLDPYTTFQRNDANDVDLLTTGSYGGVGITVGMRDSAVTVTDVLDGYSAQQEGIRIGDRLNTINGRNVEHGPIDALREYTRGEAGSTLTIGVMRDGRSQPILFKLTRETIRIRSVTLSRMLEGGIGYVRLERFSAAAGDEVRSAIRSLRAGGDLHGIVLDLRDNPGGLLDEAVSVASLFLPSGSAVVSTRGRDSSDNRVYHTHDAPIALGLPLVVLVNGNSASASEIVAGAVQDLDAGVIMGTQSYGKGLVQTVRRLPYDASLKITTARYFTPAGRSIQKVDYARQRSNNARTSPPSPTFKTLAGRAVYEHGGILPDSIVSDEIDPVIVAQLRDGGIFFKFATQYSAPLSNIPENFAVDNSLLERFRGFALEDAHLRALDSAGFGYATELAAAAHRDGYAAELTSRIDEMVSAVRDEEGRQFDQHREEIRRELLEEIAARFRSQRQRLSQSLSDDRLVLAAAALLRDGRPAYGRLLGMR
ncbi:MAG: S41 family peptidase [Bacteroidetes bacterium]|nr:S41 family peptidase [Bacteroidota bacterium]